MTLTSLQFIFLVLPGLLCLWWLTPRKLHPWLLLSYSLWLYWTLTGWHGPVVMVTLLLSDWVLAGIAVKSGDKSIKRICVIVSAIKNIGSALLFTFLQNKMAFPLGIGVYGVSGLWYVINASRGFVVWEKNPVHMLSCSSFFPSVFAGPPVDASRNGPVISLIRWDWTRFGDGCAQFVRGLAQKVIIGDVMQSFAVQFWNMPLLEMTWADCFLLLVSCLLAMYYQLMGYWNMTMGIGRMMGLYFGENVNLPFLSKGINDFFGRFNITVNRLIRRNVYIPLGGSKRSGRQFYRNVLLTCALMGLWYGVRWNTIAWGVFLGLFVLLEQTFLRSTSRFAGFFFHWLYTTTVLLLSMCFFAARTPLQALTYMTVLLGMNAGFYRSETLYLLMSNVFTLALAIIFISSLPERFSLFFKKKAPSVFALASTLWTLALLMLSVGYILT